MQEFRRERNFLRRGADPSGSTGVGGRAKGPDLRLPSPPEAPPPAPLHLREAFRRRGAECRCPTSTTGAVALYVEVVTLYFSPIGWSVFFTVFLGVNRILLARLATKFYRILIKG